MEITAQMAAENARLAKQQRKVEVFLVYLFEWY